MKTLYHGSNVVIDNIDLQKGRRGKDFGRGFYLSDDFSQAKKMAQTVVAREGRGVPIINSYEFDEHLYNNDEIKILRFDSYSEEWARFILMNRRNDTFRRVHDFDFVYGPIADDKVGVQIRLFTQEFISIEELVKRLTYIKPTFQYFFGTEAATRYLTRKAVITL